MEFVKFDVKQFSSGEWQVKIAERIYGNAIIHWNWFDKQQRDLMLLLTKIGAIKKQYGMIPVTVYAPYLPYARQDRVFEAGQDLAIETLVKAISGEYNDVSINTMALHCRMSYDITNILYQYSLDNIFKDKIIIYPDISASQHYLHNIVNKYKNVMHKRRTQDGIILTSDLSLGIAKDFLICDDICAGGRTFIECANKLREMYGNDIKIELMIYHAFLDYGLDKLKESGISKIYIINPDSYKYICELYPNDLEYFKYKDLYNV